jgi:16S rRNA (guanine966-N2)-methyltransferase
MRLTGGRWAGRSLRSARGDLRPTSDRVRESIFARIGDLEGASVLDLYAGTGALGLEALSRGARALVCVERAPRSLATLRANVESLGAVESVEVMPADARSAIRRLGRAGRCFDLVFLDPPYASDEVERALAGIREHQILRPGAMVVIERSRRHALPDLSGLAVLDERRYGDTLVTRLVAPEFEGSKQTGDPAASQASEGRIHQRAAQRVGEDESGDE